MDLLFQAYCLKHRLYNKQEDDSVEELSLSLEEIRRLREIGALKDSLNDNTYYKQIK